MKKKLFFLLTIIYSFSAFAYEGYVFIDANTNGIYDEKERVLSGILVSDGLNVVKTDKKGFFSLPGHAKERFIFITTPSGYKTYNQHYIRIKENQDLYNFGLIPYPATQKDGSHKFIHISDTEIFNTSDHQDWIGNLWEYASNEKPAFILHGGDICYEKGLKEHILLMNTENMDCPVFYSIGNHDLVKGSYGEELFEEIYGPVYYSFDVGNVHYIVTPMMGGDHTPSYKKVDIYLWLKNDLAMLPAGKPVIIFNHDLLTYGDRFIYKANETDSLDLNDYNLKAWLYGHWHIHYMKKQGNVYSICTSSLDKGGIDHSTTAFRVLHVDKSGDFSSELRYAYLDKHLNITIPRNDNVLVNEKGEIPLLVNTYTSTSPVKEIHYSCSSGNKVLINKKKLKPYTDWTWGDNFIINPAYQGKEIEIEITAYLNNGDTIRRNTVFHYRKNEQSTQLDEDWINLLGDPAHTAKNNATLAPPLKLAWVNNIGANIYMSSPLIYQGNVFVATVDENLKGEAFLAKLDGQTGKTIWKYRVRNSIKNSIAIDKNLLFAQDAEGWLYAVNTSNGKLAWEKKLPVNGLPALIDGLAIDEGIVYAGSGRGLSAFKTTDGTLLWQNEDWSQGEGTTSTLAVAEDIIISSAQWKGLYANQKNNGKLLWKSDKGGIHNRGATPAIHGNIMYVTGNKSLFIIELEKGTVLVRKEFPFSVDVTSTPLLTDQEIVFGIAEEGLIAIDRETLEMKWKFQPEDALVYTAPYTRKPAATIETSPVSVGNIIYIGCSDGNLYGINQKDGTMEWKYAFGAPVFNTVAVSGNTLIVCDFGGTVYSFTGKK
ncbi:MAG: PQQ-binding-like beta-propeller repeat protein [Bacteroidales bacterium]|nr:PQQ-binding-like beta-propeller repeat protein [Bacteroidales bacterium]